RSGMSAAAFDELVAAFVAMRQKHDNDAKERYREAVDACHALPDDIAASYLAQVKADREQYAGKGTPELTEHERDHRSALTQTEANSAGRGRRIAAQREAAAAMTTAASAILGATATPSIAFSFVRGDSFIFDAPAQAPTVWGRGGQVLWAEGEPLIIAAP